MPLVDFGSLQEHIHMTPEENLTGYESVLSNLKEAIGWVETVVPNRDEKWRAYHYKDVLQDFIELNKKGLFNRNTYPALPLLETWIAARHLTDLHEKYRGRKEKYFLQKLRASTFGPRYPFQEMEGLGNKRKGTYGRDIESELLVASQIKTPEIVRFDSADLTLDLPSCKLGIEVKRPKSTGHIVEKYLEACRQIEENPNIDLGLVMFRFDRLVYHNMRSGIYLPKPLLERKKQVTYVQSSYDNVFNFCYFQTSSFRKEFVDLFETETKQLGFKKVLGFGVTLTMPFVYGDAMHLNINGNTEITVWTFENSDEVLRRKAHSEYMEVFEYEKSKRISYTTPLVFP
jgi:hypothetical protein